jgi:hypothetical protein
MWDTEPRKILVAVDSAEDEVALAYAGVAAATSRTSGPAQVVRA